MHHKQSVGPRSSCCQLSRAVFVVSSAGGSVCSGRMSLRWGLKSVQAAYLQRLFVLGMGIVAVELVLVCNLQVPEAWGYSLLCDHVE